MGSAGELMALLGEPLEADAIQTLVAAGALVPDEDTSGGRLYLHNRAEGYELLSIGGRIVTVFVHMQADSNSQPYNGDLLQGLPKSPTRKDVHRVFGRHPSRRSKRGPSSKNTEPSWDRYDLAKVSVHFRYSGENELVDLITMMTPASAP